jgi:hypothetical protein
MSEIKFEPRNFSQLGFLEAQKHRTKYQQFINTLLTQNAQISSKNVIFLCFMKDDFEAQKKHRSTEMPKLPKFAHLLIFEYMQQCSDCSEIQCNIKIICKLF